MNYRMLRICGGSPDFAQMFYDSNALECMSYSEQLEMFQTENYTSPSSWTRCMADLGNDSADILINFVPLQQKWCLENNVEIDFSEDEDIWRFQLLCEHVRAYEPEIILFYSGVCSWFSSDQRAMLRQTFPFVRLIVGYWGDELVGQGSYAQAFGNMDIMFTSTKLYRDKFTKVGISTYVLGNCFDHLLGQRACGMNVPESVHDLVFVGYTGYGCDLHRQRYEDLLTIMGNSSLEIWADEPSIQKSKKGDGKSVKGYLKLPVRMAIKSLVSMMPTDQLLQLRDASWINWRAAKYIDAVMMSRRGEPVRGQYFVGREKITTLYPDKSHLPLSNGTDYYALLGQSKIVVNRHRDELADYGNTRVFEATGMGSCLVTDRGSSLCEFFVPDTEIVNYNSADEAIEKIEYLLENDGERQKIARAGQKRTMSEHTVANRCERVHQVIEEHLDG